MIGRARRGARFATQMQALETEIAVRAVATREAAESGASLRAAADVLFAPDGAPAALPMRAAAMRQLQGALGNAAVSEAFAALGTAPVVSDEATLDPSKQSAPDSPPKEAYTEDAPPRPQTSPLSASQPDVSPVETAVEAAVEAVAEEAVVEAAAGEPMADGEGATAAPEAAAEVDAEGKPAAEAAVEAETEAAGEAAPQGEGAASATDVPILMPEPPSELSPDAQERVDKVQGAARKTAGAQAKMPPAEANVGAARGAVSEPAAESAGRAQGALVDALGELPGPSPEIEKLCEDIKRVIKSKRPPDEESLVKAKPDEMAKDAGGQLNKNVEGDANRVAGSYDKMDKSPEGQPGQQGQPLEGVPGAQATGDVSAASAAPTPVPAENVSLQADVQANQQRMDDAGMNKPAAQAVQSGPIADARAAQGELEAAAERDPAEVIAEQEGALAQASADMSALQEQALAALQQSRAATSTGVEGGRGKMVGSEEQMRAEAGRQAQAIFAKAQSDVNAQLTPLPANAMKKWDTGVAVESEKFKQSLKKVENWIKERHSGGWGTVVGVWDELTGLPGWVTEEYDRAEQAFGDGVCTLIREISTEVNTVVALCQGIIREADRQIAEVYAGLPAELQGWAAQEREKFQGQLGALSDKANSTRDNFNRDLVERASQAVQDVRVQVHGLRQKAKGMLGRAIDAINAFLDDPIKAIINGLLELVGIPPAAFWALIDRIQQVISDIVDDPMNFANNLVEALKQGFQQFFDNFGKHFLQGLLDWLFSGLGSVGVQVPTDFSLKSVITFFLQLMGITWPNIRKILAKHIGEENVAMIEQAWAFIEPLIRQGPQGVFDMLKDQLSPQNILDTILKMAVDFVIETLIKQVVVRVIGLLNPAGAIAQAIEVIYKVLKWVFQNAARIFRLVETIVGGVADILKGNIGGMAKAVERALAGLLVPVIAFLADFLGLGDLPNKVAEAIKGFQEMVLGFVDKAIGWIVKQVKALLAKLGLGKKDESDQPDERTEEQKQADVHSAVSEGNQINENQELSLKEIHEKLDPIRKRYRLNILELVEDKATDTAATNHVFGKINPEEGGEPVEHIIKMPVLELTWSYDPAKHDPIEYRRQLKEQEDTINAMTIQWFMIRGRAFQLAKIPKPSSKFRQASSAARKAYREKRRQRLLAKVAAGAPGAENDPQVIARINDSLRLLDATHRLDSVASGRVDDISDLADRSVNRSIGPQWPGNIQRLISAVNEIPKERWAILKVNVKLVARRR